MQPIARRTRSQRTLSGGGEARRGGGGISVMCSSAGSGGGGGEMGKSSDDGARVSSASVQMPVEDERGSCDHCRKGRGGGDVVREGGEEEEEEEHSDGDSVMVISRPKRARRIMEVVDLISDSEDESVGLRSGEVSEDGEEDGEDSVDGGSWCSIGEDEGRVSERSVEEEVEMKSDSGESLPEFSVQGGARETLVERVEKFCMRSESEKELPEFSFREGERETVGEIKEEILESSGSGEKFGLRASPKGASDEDESEKGGDCSGKKQPQDGGEKLAPFRFQNMMGVSCVARRTRLKFGELERVSYTQYYKDKFSDDEVYEEKDEEEEEEEEMNGDDKDEDEDEDEEVESG